MTCIVRHRPLHYYCINALYTSSSALEQEADFQMVLCSVFSQAGFDPVLPGWVLTRFSQTYRVFIMFDIVHCRP